MPSFSGRCATSRQRSRLPQKHALIPACLGVLLAACQAGFAAPASAQTATEARQEPNEIELGRLLVLQQAELDTAIASAFAQIDGGLRDFLAAHPGESLRETLRAEWHAQASSLVTALEAILLGSDERLLQSLDLASDLEGRLSQELRAARNEIATSLRETFETNTPLPRNAPPPADPGQRQEAVDSALRAASHEVTSVVAHRMSERAARLLKALRDSAIPKATQDALQRKFSEEEDRAFSRRYNTDSGLSRVVRCSWVEVPGRLKCLPEALLISAEDISEIRVTDLPPGKRVRVKVFTAADTSSLEESLITAAREEMGNLIRRIKGLPPRPTRPTSPPGSVKAGSPPEVSIKTAASDTPDLPCHDRRIWENGKFAAPPGDVLPNRLTCDERLFYTGEQREILVAVHKNRRFSPSYGGRFQSNANALLNLRRQDREKAALLVSGREPELMLNVTIDGESPPSEETVRSTAIPLAYRRFNFETGAFYAFTSLSDKELVTEEVGNDSVKVLRTIDVSNYSQETGAFLSVFSRNNPKYGFGMGFHTSSDRPPSFYFGPTRRLRGLGEHGVMTLSAGLAILPVRTFPGIVASGSQVYPKSNPLLQGKVQLHTAGYLLINIGFSFGPVGASAGRPDETPR